MPVLSPSQIYAVARRAGFGDQEAVTWTAIALAESGGNTDAHNARGEDSRGLWQINVAPGVRPNKWGDLSDPEANARAAFEISGGGRNMRPWTVTHEANRGTSKDFRRYLDEARAGAHGQGGSDPVPALGHDGEAVGGGVGHAAHADHVQPVSDAKLVDTWQAPRSGGRRHEGIDIFAPEGTDVHAVTGGTVVRGFESRLGGVVVRIQGDDGRFYYYAHLEEGSVDHLRVGQHVDTGEVIGGVGNTGNARSTPHHLHLGIQDDGEWVNPFPLLQGLPDTEDVGAVGAGPELPLRPDEPDTDQDGVSDYDEIQRGTDPHAPDTDLDGLLDSLELRLGTDPLSADTDADSLSDALEVAKLHTDPTKADSDQDALSDDAELAAGSDPRRGTARAAGLGPLPPSPTGDSAADADHDSLSDAYEVALGTDPARADTDLDRLEDSLEVALGTNPLSADSDHDLITDAAEVDLGTDPLEADPLEPDALVGNAFGSHASGGPLDANPFTDLGGEDDDSGLSHQHGRGPAHDEHE